MLAAETKFFKESCCFHGKRRFLAKLGAQFSKKNKKSGRIGAARQKF